MTTTYIRFAISEKDNNSNEKQGFFMAMAELRNSDALYPWEADIDKVVYRWFNDHLLVPHVQSKDNKVHAISWFKSTAIEYIENMRQFAVILEAHDYTVEQLVTTRPGKILYEDDCQIVAVPFSDTFG